jgi:hypothetical protein
MAQYLAEHHSPDWRFFNRHALQVGTLKTRQIVDFSSPSSCPQLRYPAGLSYISTRFHKRTVLDIYDYLQNVSLAIKFTYL